MEKVVVDSNIIIDYLRSSKGWLPGLLSLQAKGEIEIYISSITVFELFAGSSSKKDEAKILELASGFKIISFDEKLAKFAGELTRNWKLSLPLADFIIASTALFIQAQVATRNKNHFKVVPKLKFFTPVPVPIKSGRYGTSTASSVEPVSDNGVPYLKTYKVTSF